MTALTIVFGFRDRDLQRVERCFSSLAQQTSRDFDVLFVDYGSQPDTAQAVKTLVERYDFAQYIYTETRGYPWNRAHALNIGGKQATGEYLLTTDVDIIYPSTFVDTLLTHAEPQHEVHISPYWLPQDFDDWDNVEAYQDKLDRANKAGRGICLLSGKLFQQIRGYDEYYRYYGVEDTDLSHRLRLLGIDEIWLEDTALFHQWHPAVTFETRYFMPDNIWSAMQVHFLQNTGKIERNDDDWGRVLTQADRAVLDFVDLEGSVLREHPNLHLIELPPGANLSIARLTNRFTEMPSGHALAVAHAAFPQRTRNTDRVLNITHRIVWRINRYTQLDYRANVLHNFIADFVHVPGSGVSDYYLHFPALNGVSIVVKA